METKKIISLKYIFILALLVLFIGTLSNSVHATTKDFAYLEINLLNQDPAPAKQGEYLDLRWKVVKQGNDDMNDITFHLDAKYPFSFDKIDTPEKKLGTWAGYSDDEEYYILHYKLLVDENALEDTYELDLELSDSLGSKRIRTFDIDVGEKTEPKFVLGTLTSSPTKLLADTNENELQITLENIGDEDAEVVRMELDLPEGFSETYGYSSRANLGTVAESSNKVGTFYVDIDETVFEGEWEGSVKIFYKEENDDENEYKSVTLPLRIPVNGKPMFSIEQVSTIPETVTLGSDVELHLLIKNIGTEEAESVSIRVFKESSQPFEFDEKSDFIGKLKPGESGEAVIKFDVESKATAKKYLLDLEVRGIYNDEVLIENEVVSLTVQQGNTTNWTLFIVILVAVIVVLFMIYFHTTKRKKK